MNKLLNKIAGHRYATIYLADSMYDSLPIEFFERCKVQHIRIEVVSHCDKRRGQIVHIQQNGKCNKS